VNMSTIEDLACVLIGAGLLVCGAWMVTPAAGLATAGVLLLANAVLSRRRSVGSPGKARKTRIPLSKPSDLCDN